MPLYHKNLYCSKAMSFKLEPSSKVPSVKNLNFIQNFLRKSENFPETISSI